MFGNLNRNGNGNGNGGDGDGGDGEARGRANPCEQCCANCLAGTRLMSWTCLFSILSGLLFGSYFWNSPALVLKGQVWRILVPSLFAKGILNALFSILIGFGVGMRLESRKGTMYFGHAAVVIAILTQIVYVAVIGLLIVADVPGASKQTSGGMWPVMFGLLAVEALSAPEQERPFMCFPVNVSTKSYALVLCALFSIFSLFGGPFPVDMWVGVAMGYLYHYVDLLQPSTASIQHAEVSERWRWLVTKERFVSVDAPLGDVNPMAGFMQPRGQQQQQQQGAAASGGRGRTWGSGQSGVQMGRLGGSEQSGSQQQQRASVFDSGTGYTLGGAGQQSSTAPSAPARQSSSASASTSASASASASASGVLAPSMGGNSRIPADRYEALVRKMKGNRSRSSPPAALSVAENVEQIVRHEEQQARKREELELQKQESDDDESVSEDSGEESEEMIQINLDRVRIAKPSERERQPEWPEEIESNRSGEERRPNGSVDDDLQDSAVLQEIVLHSTDERERLDISPVRDEDPDYDDTHGLLSHQREKRHSDNNPFARLRDRRASAGSDAEHGDYDDERALLHPSNSDDNVALLMKLGYSRDQVTLALSSANGDIEAAMEQLSLQSST